MAKLAVLTPSYRPDLSSFIDLHRSVLRHASADVVHHVVVPDRDVRLFEAIGSDRLSVRPVSEYLPSGFLSTYPMSIALSSIPWIPGVVSKIQAVNMRRPWPPLRGWILQQIVKIEAVSRADVDVVLTVDSDAIMIRPFGADNFIRDGAVRFYRRPGVIGDDLPRHVIWHRAAQGLLGLASDAVDPTTDYVSSPLAWDPSIVRRMQQQIVQTTGRSWVESVSRELHFSECTLYGVFVDGWCAEPERSYSVDESLCRIHWDPVPLDRAGAERFVDSIQPHDLAIVIQSTSRTPDDIREFIIESATAGDSV